MNTAPVSNAAVASPNALAGTLGKRDFGLPPAQEYVFRTLFTVDFRHYLAKVNNL